MVRSHHKPDEIRQSAPIFNKPTNHLRAQVSARPFVVMGMCGLVKTLPSLILKRNQEVRKGALVTCPPSLQHSWEKAHPNLAFLLLSLRIPVHLTRSCIICPGRLCGRWREPHRGLSRLASMRHPSSQGHPWGFLMQATWYPGPEVWGQVKQVP